MDSHNHLVIMAGGVGSSFWPVSSEEKPKQFLDILGCGRTLLQLAMDRFHGVVPAENVWVMTSERYVGYVREQLPTVPEDNIIAEPCCKNTAPCVCYVAWRIKTRDARANVIVTPSDHIVGDVPAFQSAITDAVEFAAETDAIVTIGIKPTRPETNFGYIKADLTYSSSRRKNIFRVDEFREKPSAEEAEEYVKQQGMLWNAGIFIWSVSTVINAFRVYEPAVSRIFENLRAVYGTPEEMARIKADYAKCPAISVDYAIIEKAEELFVYPASFAWSDFGTWASLRERKDKDQYGNVGIGPDVDFHESYNCLVHTASLKKVVVQGLDGYVVAEHDGQLLICKLSEEQRIKLFH